MSTKVISASINWRPRPRSGRGSGGFQPPAVGDLDVEAVADELRRARGRAGRSRPARARSRSCRPPRWRARRRARRSAGSPRARASSSSSRRSTGSVPGSAGSTRSSGRSSDVVELDREHGHVVAERARLEQRLDEAVDELVRVSRRVARGGAEQLEADVERPVAALHEAVRVEHDGAAGLERRRPRLVLVLRVDAERQAAAALEQRHAAARVDHERRQMPGRDERRVVRDRVEREVGHRREGRVGVLRDEAVQLRRPTRPG